MRALFAITLLSACLAANAAVVFDQPHNGTGTLYQSAWWDPDGSDWDIYVWDDFTLGSNQAITEIQWRGGFYYGGAYSGTVVNFTVEIYPTNITGFEPDVVNPPLVSYETGGNAGQTYAGTFAGVTMYDYHFVLPAAFQAAAGTKYWVQIEGWHHGVPEWSLAQSSMSGQHFRYLHGANMYQSISGNCVFRLLTGDAPTFTISTSSAPASGGTTSGAGAYPAGSNATVVATPNAGYGFVNWTENGVEVSNSAAYTFPVTADRALVANFVAAYTVTTSAAPSIGGTTTGDGVYNIGTQVTVDATAASSFQFVNWTEYGTPVSNSPTYTFTAGADRVLVANFALPANTVWFDFENAPLGTSLPIDLTVGGIAAHFSATGSGYSIQWANTMGFTPAGFSGRCLYPNSVFPADLLVSFDQTLTDFSIMFSPQEIGCDDSATLRVTAYRGATFVGTDIAVAFPPGTWPTGTLSIHLPQGFDNVVVHYDSHPPTCQDWGPIFLADNMIVTAAAATLLAGDLNCDGAVSFNDINPFVLFLSNLAGYQTAFPNCPLANGDINSDGLYPDFGDINPFVALLAGGK